MYWSALLSRVKVSLKYPLPMISELHNVIQISFPAYLVYFVIAYIVKIGARGVVVIVVGIRHGDTSSNPRRDWLHFT